MSLRHIWLFVVPDKLRQKVHPWHISCMSMMQSKHAHTDSVNLSMLCTRTLGKQLFSKDWIKRFAIQQDMGYCKSSCGRCEPILYTWSEFVPYTMPAIDFVISFGYFQFSGSVISIHWYLCPTNRFWKTVPLKTFNEGSVSAPKWIRISSWLSPLGCFYASTLFSCIGARCKTMDLIEMVHQIIL